MTEPHANPEDLDLYALGALDGQEKQAFETHLRACSACRDELAAARRRVSLLGLAAPPLAPSPSVKSALMQKVHAQRTPANTQTAPIEKPKIRWGLRFSLSFAAASIVLALATWWFVKVDLEQRRQIRELNAQLTATQQQLSRQDASMQALSAVTSAPDSAQITLLQQPGGPPGQAHVLYNARLGLAVYSGQIAPPPADKNYQLWLVPSSGSPVDAGLVSANPQSGPVVVRLTPGLVAKAFAVTLEPLGGMPQPTGPKVLVGAAS
jgi:anti-sigma-K factor RskA